MQRYGSFGVVTTRPHFIIAFYAIAIAAHGAAGTARASPPASAELFPEPISEPWYLQASMQQVQLDVMVTHCLVGVLHREDNSWLRTGRFGAGLVYWGNWGGMLRAIVDLDVTYGLPVQGGLFVQSFRPNGNGVEFGIQSDASRFALTVGLCTRGGCIELRKLDISTADREFSLGYSFTVTSRMVLRWLEGGKASREK
jgi:hypothetical protein